MGERKVQNKYYSPDFDPANLQRPTQPNNHQITVRMMLPMSVHCLTCGNYIYKGNKFNTRKEIVVGETYLGIRIHRFYFKCTNCSVEFTIKTDPQNSDYVVESGAKRNFEPWIEHDEFVEKDKQKRNIEEIDILVGLREMKSMKARQASISVDLMMEKLQRVNEEKAKKVEEEDDDDEEAIRAYKVLRERYVKRIYDEDIEDDDDEYEDDFGLGTSKADVKRQKTYTFGHESSPS